MRALETARQLDLLDGENAGGPFFNTIELEARPLQTAREKARYQEDVILDAFLGNPVASMTAEDALKLLPRGTPLTSARRAITNLCERGRLAKIPLSEKLTIGSMGKPIHSWRLAGDFPIREDLDH